MNKIGMIDDGEFDKLTNKDHLVVVDFSAIWCGPCQMLAPVVEDLAEKYKGTYDFFNVDVDSAKNLAKRFGIMAVPTIIAFKNGKEVDRTSGYMNIDEFEAFLNFANNK